MTEKIQMDKLIDLITHDDEIKRIERTINTDKYFISRRDVLVLPAGTPLLLTNPALSYVVVSPGVYRRVRSGKPVEQWTSALSIANNFPDGPFLTMTRFRMAQLLYTSYREKEALAASARISVMWSTLKDETEASIEDLKDIFRNWKIKERDGGYIFVSELTALLRWCNEELASWLIM